MKKITVSILAHVDAGKTTLAEAMLFSAGAIRSAGRVDHGNTALDTHSLEKERGITIFAGQAYFTAHDTEFTLLDTPGHVDFSAETERMLGITDYAVLVISSTDGVQAHTRTLWDLLRAYNVPTFIFVTKSDYARKSEADIIGELLQELGNCRKYDANDSNSTFAENVAMTDEALLDKYLSSGDIGVDDISEAIKTRKIFPVFFGSGMKGTGVAEFIKALSVYTREPLYKSNFAAKVYKISHDKSDRLTHIKVTGGALRVKDTVSYGGREEKINSIRIYFGDKYKTVNEAPAGCVCAVTGLSETYAGQGLGEETASDEAILTPVMNYRIVLPDGVDPKVMMPKLKTLTEEDPALSITWDTRLSEIHTELMGEVQTEILKALIFERFGVSVTIDSGRVVYKETIDNTVEGVGHFEPLRHYAEVHLIMEPLPRGSGVVFSSKLSVNELDTNWQRLILQNLSEKQHLGVLTASPLTDVKITLSAGRAHIKHTEGGDFRQATYRAVRQGLMQAKSRLLEPYYSFRLSVPTSSVSRAMSDIRLMAGECDTPESDGEFSIICGKAPVTTIGTYSSSVASYTGGRGSLALTLCGYGDCHDAEKVIADAAYDPEGDLENTPDSVFCAHGGGFTVKWNKVTEYMHLESTLCPVRADTGKNRRKNISIDEKELEAIMLKEFGPIKRPVYSEPVTVSAEKRHKSYVRSTKTKYLIIDGYNVIHSFPELSEMAEDDLDGAREKLINILINYRAFTGCEVVLVFDAYGVTGGTGEKNDRHGVKVVYTKENETGDAYIEKLICEIGKNEQIRVVTSDGLIQISALRAGVLRLSAKEFEEEINMVDEEIGEIIKKE